MNKDAQRRVAEEAARLMAEGIESEYLDAKERAVLTLGLGSQTRLPSNRQIKEYIGRITKDQLGASEVERRIREMREIALEIMKLIEHCDPYLIGSTLSGDIRLSSDIDLHAYSDDFNELKDLLTVSGYEEVEEELVENRKGRFVHLRWHEKNYPVEITIYPWSWRDTVPISSVTQKPMKRADLAAVKRLLNL
jgi:predicted nucleotidyltransferase